MPPKKKADAADGLALLGVVFLFVGLGFALSFWWAMTVTGGLIFALGVRGAGR